MASNNKNYTVQSLERAINILEKLSEEERGISLTRLSDKLGLHKSTVHRLLTTMMDYGYVEQDATTGRYNLGLRLLRLSNVLLDRIDIRREAKPFLRKLNALTNEVVHLVVLNSYDVVYIDKIESYQSVTINSSIGKVVPVHCTAVGKVLLSEMPKEKVIEILAKKGMKKYTDRTITDPELFLEELTLARKRGYALDENEHEPEIRCIAAPIKDHRGQIIAAISVAGPESRITDDRMELLIESVVDTAKNISARLGYEG